MIRNRATRIVFVTSLGLAAAACTVEKSANPLSPGLAGPIPGVVISAPVLAEPVRGSLILVASQPVTLGFNVATSNSPRPFWYELQVSDSPSFNKIIDQATIEQPATGGRVTHQVAATLSAEQAYHWRVRALDGANTGLYSDVSSFEVITPVVLQAPVPVSPANGATVPLGRVTVVVSNTVATGPIPNPILYHFEAALDASFTAMAGLTVPQGSGTTSASTDLVSDRLYFWRVRASTEARLGVVYSNWSAVSTFRTPIDTAPPAGGGGTGGGDAGGGSTSGGGGAGDELDLSHVKWLHRNVSSWPVSSTVTKVSVTHDSVCVDHTKAGGFPTSVFGDILVEGNVWIFARINGQWYGATWDWLRSGQICKGVTAPEFGADQIRISPMDSSWAPRAGDQIGFMISTRARDGVSAGEERTNVKMVTWPY